MVSFSDFEALIIPLVMGVIGIVNAMIIWNLYYRGIVIDAMIQNTISIEDLMTIIIVMWFIVGIILAAVKR